MADLTITPAPVEGPTIDTAALAALPPVVEAPAVASLEPVQAPAVEAPVETPAPVEAPQEASPKAVETLLAAAPESVAPVEAPRPEGEVAPVVTPESTEGGQSDEPAPPPEVKFEPFTLPEGIQLDNDRVKEFTGLLADLETNGKLEHNLAQEFGQKAVEFHINEVKRVAEDLTKFYQTAWDKQKTDWKESFLKDPEIGGNRFQTTVNSAISFIKTHGGTEDQQTEFRNLMETSGLGNHPAMIRMLANANTAMSEGKPLAAAKPVSAPKSKITAMYGNK